MKLIFFGVVGTFLIGGIGSKRRKQLTVTGFVAGFLKKQSCILLHLACEMLSIEKDPPRCNGITLMIM